MGPKSSLNPKITSFLSISKLFSRGIWGSKRPISQISPRKTQVGREAVRSEGTQHVPIHRVTQGKTCDGPTPPKPPNPQNN
eukprot:600649-Amphidinium_carterae.1